uniref:Solute carrier family 35 member F3 n=1 Tax=Takifugu rubripes TaxID=31033 RepID=H2UXS4_TAKRU
MHCCLGIVGKVNKWKDQRCFQAYSHLHFSLLIASSGMHVLKSFIVSVTLLGGGGEGGDVAPIVASVHTLFNTYGACHLCDGQNAVGTTESQSAGGAAGTEVGSSRRRLHCCIRVTTVQVRKALWGVAMVMCMCSSWAGFTQLAKLTFKKFDRPFTLTWFATTWNCLFFPLYYKSATCARTQRDRHPDRDSGECCRFFGDDGLTPRVFFTKVAPFGLLWVLTNYLYLQALRKINTTDASALFCCNKAFVFLLLVAAILAIAGIVMMTYADGFHSHSVIGITFVVASASMSALYKVWSWGVPNLAEAALFLSIVGSANFVFISFVPVILYFTHVEYIGSPADIPWAYLCGVAGLLFAFNVLVNFGIAITYPTLISLGIVLSVPVNAMVDLYTCDINFNTVRLIAVFIICLASSCFCCQKTGTSAIIQLSTKLRKRNEPAEGGGEAGATTGLNWRGRTRTSMTFAH